MFLEVVLHVSFACPDGHLTGTTGTMLTVLFRFLAVLMHVSNYITAITWLTNLTDVLHLAYLVASTKFASTMIEYFCESRRAHGLPMLTNDIYFWYILNISILLHSCFTYVYALISDNAY